MAKKKELSKDQRSLIVNAHKNGMGYKSISKKFDIPVSTIQSIIRKLKSYQTVENLIGRRRKQKLSARCTRNIVRLVEKTLRTTTNLLFINIYGKSKFP